MIPPRYQRRDLYFRLMARTGLFDSLKPVEGFEPRRIVFVCQGNVCRSPFAEALVKARGKEAISCGLDAAPGSRAEASAIRVATEFGVDLAPHRSRRYSQNELLVGDLVLAMDPKHLGRIKAQGVRSGIQVGLLGAYLAPSRPLIFDPYGMADQGFRRCFAFILEAISTVTDASR